MEPTSPVMMETETWDMKVISEAGANDSEKPGTESPQLSRVAISETDFESMDKEKLHELWKEQDRFIDQLEKSLQETKTFVADLEAKNQVLVHAQQDPSRRDQLLVFRLGQKEQEIQELSNQIAELKASQAPGTSQLKNTLIDPAINIVIENLKKELDQSKRKMQETQEELSSWKFTPDSATGKRLTSKCRQLLQENEEIGKMISSGKLAKLENELSMQKALCEEMKKNQEEIDDFVQELDLDVEGMQSTIYFLQQQLKEAKECIASYESGKKPVSTENETKEETSIA